jgi:predicted ATP-dependent serine protease
VRYSLQGDKRIQELARRGFQRILVPDRNAEEITGAGIRLEGVRLEAVTDIGQAVNLTAVRRTSG